ESSYLSRIVKTKNPFVIADLQIEKSYIDPIEKKSNIKDTIHSKMGIPIIISNKIIGIVCFESYEIDLYQPSHIFLAISFASYLALAFQNHILKEEQKRRILELEAIKTIFESMNKSMELDNLCFQIGELIYKIYKCDVVYIGYLDKDKEKIYTPFFLVYGNNEKVEPMKLGEGLTSIVIKQKKPLIINSSDRTEILKLGGKVRIGNPPKSWVGIPLISRDEAIGIVSIQQFDIENYFSAEDIKLLQILANSISAVIEKAFLLNQAQKNEEESRIIAEISREITSFLDINKIIQQIIELVFPVISNTSAAIYLKKDDGYYHCVAAVGEDSKILLNDKFLPSEGIVGKSIALKKTIIENDLSTNTEAILIKGTTEENLNEKIMSIPLFLEDEIEGALVIWREKDEDKFSKHDQQFAENIAVSIGVALHNAKLYKKIEDAKKEAEYANLMKTQFLSNMSHELRTPLNCIINFSYLIQRTLPESSWPEEYDMLRRVEESGRYLLSLINDILDLAKIESGKMELFKEYFDIHEILGPILSNIQALLTDKPVSLICEVDQSLPNIYADKTRIRQIIFNLLSNAVKFTKEGYIRLKIYLEDESKFIFSVEDTGIGMKKEDIEKAFLEFVQIDGGTNREVKGTGLGLPIAKKFIEMHNGNIWVQSELNKGSIFTFSIPYEKVEKQIETAISINNIDYEQFEIKENETDQNNLNKVDNKVDKYKDIPDKIVVIDDEDDFVKFVDKELNQKWKIISAQNAIDAFILIEKYLPDIIFLDLIMPEIDGWTILKKIKSNKKYSNIPVIVCSILNEEHYSKELKADAFLPKPTDQQQLRKILQTFIKDNKNGTILIIDDDKNNIDILKSFITQKMYEIESVKTSKEAFAKIFELDGKGIVLLDLMLPDEDGFEILKKLEKNNINLPKIIIVSNRDLTNDERRYIENKNIEYIRKDNFTKKNLINILKRNFK
ncbi:MAG: response regulator, partial [Spirochaetota bacterium]